jgi:DNA polymerase type B, organellar and viral
MTHAGNHPMKNSEILVPIASTVRLATTPPGWDSQTEVSLSSAGFTASDSEDFMTICFDTEFVGPPEAMTRDDILAGKAKYSVLSYQFHCRTASGEQWSGIICPDDDKRITLGEFIVFALGSGVKEHQIVLPRHFSLVGHFTRADIPAFADFEDLQRSLSNVRNTFVTTDRRLKFALDNGVKLTASLRDTMLLSPGDSKSLDAIGEMLGIPKILLRNDSRDERQAKKRMDLVRSGEWPLFRRYAIHDATICSDFTWQIIDQYERLTGTKRIPVTLTSIGIDRLMASWKQQGLDAEAVVGRESHRQKRWHDNLGHYITSNVNVLSVDCAEHERLASEAYHGGRSEQFWFGPGFRADWVDYDLASAYPTAMSKIGKPDWSCIKVTNDPHEFGIDTLGCARVQFEFPESVRYPTLPVRTANGLIFPQKGESHCAAPEIYLAMRLGAKVTIKHGIIVPTDASTPIFGPFIRHCLDQRKQHPKGSFHNLFWKETANAIYGKTAQGLLGKRVYVMNAGGTQPLPPSKITNPYFAAYITSYVRAVLGEIINRLPASVCIFSCTTDGFISNASPSDIAQAQLGPLGISFSAAREVLTGGRSVLEAKHKIAVPLGWKIRGQATLVEGEPVEGEPGFNIVLAKGGIHLDQDFDTLFARNAEIVRMFFDRRPHDEIVFSALTGIRDIVEHGADLVAKRIKRRLNMEYDWKRRPLATTDHPGYSHLCFSTAPWETVEQFQSMRYLFERYSSKHPVSLKTAADFEQLAYYVESYNRLPEAERKSLRKDRTDLRKLRSVLSAARHSKEFGLAEIEGVRTAQQFAALLESCGIPCTRADAENGKRKSVARHSVPETDRAVAAVKRLGELLPALEGSELFAIVTPAFSILANDPTRCTDISCILSDKSSDQWQAQVAAMYPRAAFSRGVQLP